MTELQRTKGMSEEEEGMKGTRKRRKVGESTRCLGGSMGNRKIENLIRNL